MQAQPETFMAIKNRSSIRNDVARLMPARLISTNELGVRQKFDEPFIKQWVGGDAITCRFLFQEHFEGYPQGKIWLATNHKPAVEGTDHGIWRRVQMIPFEATFAKEDQDPTLQEKLMAELPGILNWALEGFKRWRIEGLNPPEAILSAVAEYRSDMDTLGQWIAEECEIREDFMMLRNDLYTNYEAWAHSAGFRWKLSRNQFTQQLEERGYKTKRTTMRRGGNSAKGLFVLGMRLANQECFAVPYALRNSS